MTEIDDVPEKKFGNINSDKAPIEASANFDESTVNRAKETSNEDENPIISVTLKNIDEAIIQYLDKEIKPIIKVSGESVRVPVIYGNSERWNSIQKEGVYRNNKGKIETPLLMIRRTNVLRNASLINPVNKLHKYIYEVKWNKRNGYDKFDVLNSIVPSKQFVEVTAPDFIEVNYEAIIWTESHEHMNSVIEQINFEIDEFWGKKGGFKFKVKTDEFQNQTDLPADAPRTVKSTFNLMARGYLVPEYSLHKPTSKNIYSYKKMVTFTEVEK